MAATQHLYFASNQQPALIIARLLKMPGCRQILRRLEAGSLTLAELALSAEELELFRQLRRVNLIVCYELGGQVRYRAHRYPPLVRQALAA